MRTIFGIIAVSALAACATPPGQIPDSDYVWETKHLDVGYQAAYRNLREGFKACDTNEVAEGDVYTDIREARLTAYLANKGWAFSTGRTDLVAGTIKVSAMNGGGSELKVGVLSTYDRPTFGAPGQIRARWVRWASGDLACD